MKNLGTIDRVLRVVLGGALTVWALLRLLSGGAAILAAGGCRPDRTGRGFCGNRRARLLPALPAAGMEQRPATTTQ